MDNQSLRVSRGMTRGGQFTFEVDGEPMLAYEGETVATALLASGRRTFRWTQKGLRPRGIFCGMGICFDCTMTVNGMPNVRTCVTLAEPGMVVSTQHGLPEVLADVQY